MTDAAVEALREIQRVLYPTQEDIERLSLPTSDGVYQWDADTLDVILEVLHKPAVLALLKA